MRSPTIETTDTTQVGTQKLESEARFHQMAEGSPLIMWISGVDKLCTGFNQAWLSFTGRSIDDELGNGWASGVHEDDRDRCLTIYTGAFDQRLPFSMEYRLQRNDGQYCWINDAGWPRFLDDGTFAGYIGCCLMIDDHKSPKKRDMN
jgi:PAS domain S-box-containing protein